MLDLGIVDKLPNSSKVVFVITAKDLKYVIEETAIQTAREIKLKYASNKNK